MIGALQRVDGYVNRRCPGDALHRAQGFTDPKHRRVVALALANRHTPVKGNAVEDGAHGLDGCSVCCLAVPQPPPSRGCYRSGLSGLQEVLGEVDGRHASPNEPRHSIMRVALALTQDPHSFYPRSRILALRVLLNRLEHVPGAQ